MTSPKLRRLPVAAMADHRRASCCTASCECPEIPGGFTAVEERRCSASRFQSLRSGWRGLKHRSQFADVFRPAIGDQDPLGRMVHPRLAVRRSFLSTCRKCSARSSRSSRQLRGLGRKTRPGGRRDSREGISCPVESRCASGCVDVRIKRPSKPPLSPSRQKMPVSMTSVRRSSASGHRFRYFDEECCPRIVLKQSRRLSATLGRG